MDSSFPYLASMTREPFLFYEMRATARLYMEGLSDEEIVDRVITENSYQYPTERSLKMVSISSLYCKGALYGVVSLYLWGETLFLHTLSHNDFSIHQ